MPGGVGRVTKQEASMTDSTATTDPATQPLRSPLHDRHVALGA